jgi:hypothetical protein
LESGWAIFETHCTELFGWLISSAAGTGCNNGERHRSCLNTRILRAGDVTLASRTSVGSDIESVWTVVLTARHNGAVASTWATFAHDAAVFVARPSERADTADGRAFEGRAVGAVRNVTGAQFTTVLVVPVTSTSAVLPARVASHRTHGIHAVTSVYGMVTIVMSM